MNNLIPITIAIIPALFFFESTASADTTNLIYPNDDGHLIQNHSLGGTAGMDPQKVAQAKSTRECLPAKDFPEGNWGEVRDNCQLSMRFDKEVFTNGEPIILTLLMRNENNKMVSYDRLSVGYGDGPIGFKVTTSDGREIPQHVFPIGVWSVTTADLYPQTQIKFLERLDKRFDLTNDVYYVQANIRIGDLGPKITGKPILDSNGVFKPKLDEHGFPTNIAIIQEPSDPTSIYNLQSAKVKIQIESAH